MFIFSLLFFLASPNFVYASVCSSDGYTIALINGIFTNELEAADNSDKLKKKFSSDTFNSEPVKFITLHNPSHLEGVGDLWKSFQQKLGDIFGMPVSDSDLTTLILSLQADLTTEKVLFVSHSQGNFYANALFPRVTDREGGISSESAAVYAVATPASWVPKGGQWITSDTDQVISGWVGTLSEDAIMPPNASIPNPDPENNNGHGFSDMYLAYEGPRMIKEMRGTMSTLRSFGGKEASPCLSVAENDIAHRSTILALAVADDAAHVARVAPPLAYQGIASTGKFGANMLASLIRSVGSAGYFASSGVTYGIAQTVGGTQTLIALVPKGTPPSAVTNNLSGLLSTLTLAAPTPTPPPPTPIGLPYVDLNGSTKADVEKPTAPPTTPPTQSTLEKLTAEVARLSKLVAEIKAAQVSAGQVAGISTVVPNYTLLANSLGSGGGGNSVNTTAENSPTPTLPLSGGGGDASSTDPLPEETPPEEIPPEATITPDTTAPDAPLVTSPTTTPALFSADTVFVIAGTAEASSTVIASFVGTDPLLVMLAPVTASGTWSFSLNLPEGNYLLSFTAVDEAGNISSSTELVLSTVTPPPPPEPFTPIAPDSILLYEIAWQGTRASPTDEWLEIKNNTDIAIDLSTLRIETSDGGLAIPLSGILAPYSFAVIAADPGALVGVTPSLVADFATGLDDTGEGVRLVQVNPNDLTTTLIDELVFCADWCGKGASPGTTMGRTLGTTGDTTDDWVTTPYGFFIATDRNGGPITGTPFLETLQVIPD